MRDAGHQTPDAGHRTAKKAKIIYPPPRGVDIINTYADNCDTGYKLSDYHPTTGHLSCFCFFLYLY